MNNTNTPSLKPIKTAADLAASDIVAMYSGKARHCCCGCSGKHYDSETSEKAMATMKKRILKVLVANAAAACVYDSFVSIDIEDRCYIAYFDTTKCFKAPSSSRDAGWSL